jgi:signal transduction histidine kinase
MSRLGGWVQMQVQPLVAGETMEPKLPLGYRRGLDLCSAIVALLALAALVGWASGWTRLASFGRGWVPMSPNTAACFLLLAAGGFAVGRPRARGGALVAVAAVAAIAGGRLLEYVLHVELGADRWLFDVPAESFGLAPVGRMGMFSAFNLLTAAAALAFLAWRRQRTAELVAGLLGAAVGLEGLGFGLGYAHAIPTQYARAMAMSLPSALAFAAFGVGVVLRATGTTLQRQRALEAALREANRDLEQRVRQRTAELEVRNRELQDFAYVASHDLQEPLRKVQAFGDRLADRWGEALGSEGQDYLRRMRDAATRMRRLIDDLLSFSRVSTRGRPFAATQLRRCAEEALTDLEARIEQTGATVELRALPTIEADATQMRQLFLNLVGNALKYHRPGEAPRVRVWAEGDGLPRNGSVRLLVRDEGIGFDERYLDRVFAPFQRLHGRGVYEGTGIGLAICRRIVERHRGTITARSAPGAGATFEVTLPARQPTDNHQPANRQEVAS